MMNPLIPYLACMLKTIGFQYFHFNLIEFWPSKYFVSMSFI